MIGAGPDMASFPWGGATIAVVAVARCPLSWSDASTSPAGRPRRLRPRRPRHRAEDADIALRAAGQPVGAGPDLDHRDGHRQPRLLRLRHALLGGRQARAPA